MKKEKIKLILKTILFVFLFNRMLKCLIVPLLVSSITCAIGSLDLSLSGKIATR